MSSEVQLGDDPYLYHAHVQEIFEPLGPVVVYIVELGQKRKVPYSSLHPPSSPNRHGPEAKGHSTSDPGSTAFVTDRRLRRKKFTMPGAADFQLPNNNTVRSPRSTAVGNRRVPDINHKLVAITAPSTITNCMPAMVEGVDASGYCMVTSSMPMAPMTHMTSMTSSPGMGMGHGGMEMGPGVVYWSPMINVPFVNTMGHVNYSCPASQDPSGKDLPSDMNTLRYFFNLGIEVHRMNSGMQPPLNSYGSSSPLPQLMSNGPPSSPMLMTSMEQGYSSAPPQGQSMSQGQVVYFMNPQGYPAPPCTAYQPVMAPPTHLPCPPVAVQ